MLGAMTRRYHREIYFALEDQENLSEKDYFC
jgi:hypothetical protein